MQSGDCRRNAGNRLGLFREEALDAYNRGALGTIRVRMPIACSAGSATVAVVVAVGIALLFVLRVSPTVVADGTVISVSMASAGMSGVLGGRPRAEKLELIAVAEPESSARFVSIGEEVMLECRTSFARGFCGAGVVGKVDAGGGITRQRHPQGSADQHKPLYRVYVDLSQPANLRRNYFRLGAGMPVRLHFSLGRRRLVDWILGGARD